MSYEVRLDIFQGPLDLLLYLIKKNEIDIYNIPIALITQQYLETLEWMKSLNLDLAGEYLVLASTLLLIKSRMLLPDDSPEGAGEDETGEDPRQDLVRQLLEYQAFKEAALDLDGRPWLERDVFKRGSYPDLPPAGTEEETIAEVGIVELVDAFRRVISSLEKEELMQINSEKLSVTDRINEILERLREAGQVSFQELLEGGRDRRRIVYTFLAILELMKLRMIKAYQTGPFGPIRIFPAVEEEPDGA
ncbi:MAG: segregation/condensation protein A [Deltaproteobacteria bacterium HGW-Deltaproteobacteria-19]|jgi:segregation and condensation protein A|nr:MAG: segregation/condensation protein A [Deltaproteobacteria bacterium HGW-Deltaproteobacteria-19]